MPHDWKWYAGSNDEHFSIGPLDTREAAINEGRGNFDEGFHIIEAYKASVEIADHFFIDPVLEIICENVDEEHCDSEGNNVPLFEPSDEASKRLEALMRNLLRDWQRNEGITIDPYTFTGTRNEEFIPAPPGMTDLMLPPESIDSYLDSIPHRQLVADGVAEPCPCGDNDGLWCSLPGCPYAKREAA